MFLRMRSAKKNNFMEKIIGIRGIKLLCVAALCAVFALLTSCTAMLVSDDNNPKLAWEEFSEYVSEGDFPAAFDMTKNGSISSQSEVDSEYTELLLKAVADSYEYEFVSDTDVFGVTAWQTIKITALDMRELAEKAVKEAVKEAKDYAYKNGSYETDEEIKAAVNSKMTELLTSPGNCLTTTVIRVEFSYSDGKWMPVMSDTLYDAISGYSAYTDKAIADCLKRMNS